MEKVLRKRAWRDLKENKFRYFALAFLIIISMYLVISLVGAADTIVDGTTKQAKKHKLEDGQFQVFVPLTTKQKENFTKKGLTVEETFYLDFRQKDGSKLRIFKNRKKVNKINLDEGRLAKNKSEVVVEKRYAQEHNLKTGSKITIDGNFYKITGIGSVPDYDACYEKLSDSTVDSKQFGLAFVTEDAYENLKDNENSIQSEEYIYAYRLNGAMTQKQLKNKLKKITFNPDDVDDPYFKDYWEETAGKKDDIKDGIKKLTDASTQMSDGLNKLSENNETLQKGANQIFQAYLKTAESQLTSFGVTSLTENNYANILKSLIAKSSDGLTRLSLESAKEQLDALKTYRDGIKAYTNGVKKASDGSSKLKEGTDQLEEGTKELMKAFDMETSNLTQFLKADDNIRIGAAAGDQVISKLAGMVAGVIIMILFTYVISVFVIHEIEKENSIIGTLYALGVIKKQLLKYYLTVPVIVTFLAGLAGTIIGYSPIGIPTQMQDCYDYFSIPDLSPELLIYLLVYGIVMPPLVAVIVNYFVIRKKLSIDSGKLYATTSKKAIEESSDVFINMMIPMMGMIVGLSVIIFAIVMYLMIKVMIDRSAQNIALMKVFGYRKKEIKKLYLDGNFYMIAIGALISVPLSKKLMDAMYPVMVSNIACGMNLSFTWQMYALIYAGIIITYLVINKLLVRKIYKVGLSDALKNRE